MRIEINTLCSFPSIRNRRGNNNKKHTIHIYVLRYCVWWLRCKSHKHGATRPHSRKAAPPLLLLTIMAANERTRFVYAPHANTDGRLGITSLLCVYATHKSATKFTRYKPTINNLPGATNRNSRNWTKRQYACVGIRLVIQRGYPASRKR